MSNVVEFPGGKPPAEGYSEEYVDRLHAEAFRDLESAISDCAIMASIAVQVRGVPGRGYVEEAQGRLPRRLARREASDMKMLRWLRSRLTAKRRLRIQAQQIPPAGSERNDQPETTAKIERWLASSELMPPT
jgi:hypothetical protein